MALAIRIAQRSSRSVDIRALRSRYLATPYGDFHDPTINFDNNPIQGKLAGLVDIAQEKNYQFIRQPVTVGRSEQHPGRHDIQQARSEQRSFLSGSGARRNDVHGPGIGHFLHTLQLQHDDAAGRRRRDGELAGPVDAERAVDDSNDRRGRFPRRRGKAHADLGAQLHGRSHFSGEHAHESRRLDRARIRILRGIGRQQEQRAAIHPP